MGVLFAMIRTSSDRIRRLNSHLVVYDEIGKAIGESKNLQGLLDVVLHHFARATFADWGLLLLKSQFSSSLEIRGRVSTPTERDDHGGKGVSGTDAARSSGHAGEKRG
jgi:hypothetical protein